MDSKALTKIQTIMLITVVLIATVGGGAAYVLWRASLPPPENIRIGFCGDLDMPSGKGAWRGVTLAAEQINAEGGVLGRNLTLIAEDDDSATAPYDVAVATNALTRLITVDEADYIIAACGLNVILPYQDICSEHKKILISIAVGADNYTQRVLDDYDRYKYSFRTAPTNVSTSSVGALGDIITVGNYTGFTKIALLFQESASTRQMASMLNSSLPKHGFELVYSNFVPITVSDFASSFAAVEESGAEILFPVIVNQAAVPLVKEWYDRQAPFVVWGIIGMASESSFWNVTEGKCDTVTFAGQAPVAGYPLTNKTVPTRQAYIQRWEEAPSMNAISAYDALRFILSDAIRRAGTTETEAVIKALEKTNIETSCARHFVFTSSHDVMVGTGAVNSPVEDYMVMCFFQWQNGTQVLVKPEAIMKETGATYKYPPWQGAWSK